MKSNLPEVFPLVRILDLSEMEIVFTEPITQHFQHLEHVSIPENWGANQSFFPSLEQLLVLNRQLKHVTIPSFRK